MSISQLSSAADETIKGKIREEKQIIVFLNNIYMLIVIIGVVYAPNRYLT